MQRFAITDRTLLTARNRGWRPALAERCGSLAADGVDCILIREKDLPAGELIGLCRAVREAAAGTACRVLVASRVDIAVAADLAGVHLSSAAGELTPEQARRLFARAGLAAPFVSVSCHDLREVERAALHHASAILFAPIFGKRVAGADVAPGVGLDALQSACERAGDVPVFALGGVTLENAGQCLAAGAAGVAGIRLFFAP